MARGNAKHQAAVAATEDLVQELRVDCHGQLAALRKVAGLLDELLSTRQSVGLGFMTEDARTARGKQVVADRAAARGVANRNEGVGLAWMNTTTPLGSGQVAAPVTVPAVSASAEILFALQDHVRRLARPAAIAAAAAVPGSHGRAPLGLPTTDTDIAGLTRQLDDLVDVYGNRRGLEALLRELDHLEAIAREVIDGPARTNWPGQCPWCGHTSLVMHNHDGKGRATQLVRCEGKHPCECSIEFCDCHRNPIRNRHEWVNSGRASHHWNDLRNLQAKRKELNVMETRALDAIERIRELHQPHYEINGVRHTHYVTTSEPPADHVCVIDGNEHCEPELDEHLVPACVECRYATPDGDPASPFWPCPTYQATDLTQTAGDQADDSTTTQE